MSFHLPVSIGSLLLAVRNRTIVYNNEPFRFMIYCLLFVENVSHGQISFYCIYFGYCDIFFLAILHAGPNQGESKSFLLYDGLDCFSDFDAA